MTVQDEMAWNSRRADENDVGFLARIVLEAYRMSGDHSVWDENLEPTETPAIDFLRVMLLADASNWGAIGDFVIIEGAAGPVAACAVFSPSKDPNRYKPFDLECLPQVAGELGWSDDHCREFRHRYERAWSGNIDWLAPQSEKIIECVAVLPAERGKGLGHILMKTAFQIAREDKAKSIGIMVANHNEAAKKLYEAHFEPYATYHPAYFDHSFSGITKFKATLD